MRTFLIAVLLFGAGLLKAQPELLESLRQSMQEQYAQGNYPKALTYALSLVTEAGNVYGKQDRRVGDALEQVGKLYLDLKEYASATQWYTRALGHRQNNIGHRSPEVGRCQALLGEVYFEKGELRVALEYLQNAIAVLENSPGEYQIWLAHPLEILAALRYTEQNYAEAETLYQRVLNLQEAAYGLQSAPLARSLNNLAGVYLAQGNHQRARGVYTHALNMQRAVLGREHAEIATTLVNLGVLHDQRGEFDRAEDYLLDALEIREKQLPLNHPLLGATIDNLLTLYVSIGDFRKAEARLATIREAREAAFGPNTLPLAPVYDKYASYHLARTDVPTAIRYMEKALSIREEHLGLRADPVAANLYNIGRLYNVTGNHDQARITLTRALDIYDINQPGDQGVIAALFAEIAATDLAQGRMDEAEESLLAIYYIKERVFGESHFETTAALEEILKFYQMTEQPAAVQDIEEKLARAAELRRLEAEK
ncbi:MAG: tetratricopeptide repeat protein [Bacteroidota bacterium]